MALLPRTVQFPSSRRYVLDALASLADPEYQRAAWLEQRHSRPDWHDDLDLNIHILYDDVAVLPDPTRAVGAVLFEGDELARLTDLDAVLGPLIDALGDVADAEYLAHEDWPLVCHAAALTLAAMVRVRGYEDPAPPPVIL